MNKDVIAHRHRQRVHRVRLKFGIVSLLEGSGQKLEEHPPERGLDGVDAAIEVRFADHLWHVAVFVEEPAGLVDVGAEEGRGHQGDGVITSAVDKRV